MNKFKYRGYRVVRDSGKYRVQTRFMIFWWINMRGNFKYPAVIGRDVRKFNTEEEAISYIDGLVD